MPELIAVYWGPLMVSQLMEYTVLYGLEHAYTAFTVEICKHE